jgi:hypothetical protein
MFETVNFLEAALWGVIGFAFLVAAIRFSAGRRSQCAVLAIAFIAFGASDIVEAHTGAWWRPWWLLLWKGACVVMLLVHFAKYIQARRQREC